MYKAIKIGLENIPDKKLLFFEGKAITIKQFLADINRVSEELSRRGVKKGEVVTINLPNTVNSIVAFYAVNKCGAIANMVHPLMPFKELRDIINEVKSRFLITFDVYYAQAEGITAMDMDVIICRISDYLPIVKKQIYSMTEPKLNESKLRYYADIIKERKIANINFAENSADSIAVYLHSGGTTGGAKTVTLTNKVFNALTESLSYVIDNKRHDAHSSLMVLPMFHGFGLGVSMHTMLRLGFPISLMPKFAPKKFASLVKKHQVDLCAGVPKMFEKLYQLDDKNFSNLQTLNYIYCGGEKLTFALKEKFDKRIKTINPDAEILEGYGLTETVTVCTLNHKNDYDDNCVGYPLQNIEMGAISTEGKLLPIGEKGELVVRGTTMMNGYFGEGGNDDAFIDIDGIRYVRTGDLGYLDAKGKVYFLDRIKRIFKISGFNVYPSEVERIVVTVNGVTDCHCYEKQRDGKLTVALKIVAEGEQEALRKAIVAKVADRLIKYAIPSEICFVESLPKTLVGKTDIKAINAEESNEK